MRAESGRDGSANVSAGEGSFLRERGQLPTTAVLPSGRATRRVSPGDRVICTHSNGGQRNAVGVSGIQRPRAAVAASGGYRTCP